MNEVTEQDVLTGEKQISVLQRDGKAVEIVVRAMSWALACKVSTMPDAGDSMVHIILNCVPKEKATDEFLGTLTPAALTEIATTAMQLTNGVDALKKRMAAGKNEPETAPLTPISSPPATS